DPFHRSPHPAGRWCHPGRKRRPARLGPGPAAAALCCRLLGQGHPRRDDEDVRQGRGVGLQGRTVPELHVVPPGHRTGRPAARQPGDGQHRAAGHLQAGARLVAPDLGLPVPRRRPPEQVLRQRPRRADEEDGGGPAQGEDPRPDLLRHAPRRPEDEEEGQRARRPGRREAAHAARRHLADAGPLDRRQPDADGLRRDLHRPADRRHRRPGQPAAERAEHEVQRGHVADRADVAPGGLRPADREHEGLAGHGRRQAAQLPGGGRQGDRLEHGRAPEAGGRAGRQLPQAGPGRLRPQHQCLPRACAEDVPGFGRGQDLAGRDAGQDQRAEV
ncbi:MAG: TRAP-type C4-dicarboxylate transport system, periplasmic component, partial [uncultured Ramlibacter sp.]